MRTLATLASDIASTTALASRSIPHVDRIDSVETPIDRLRKIMRRFRNRDERNDAGSWRGMGDIRNAHGGTKDEVRGLLIELVATGEVEASVCANGIFWRGSK